MPRRRITAGMEQEEREIREAALDLVKRDVELRRTVYSWFWENLVLKSPELRAVKCNLLEEEIVSWRVYLSAAEYGGWGDWVDTFREMGGDAVVRLEDVRVSYRLLSPTGAVEGELKTRFDVHFGVTFSNTQRRNGKVFVAAIRVSISSLTITNLGGVEGNTKWWGWSDLGFTGCVGTEVRLNPWNVVNLTLSSEKPLADWATILSRIFVKSEKMFQWYSLCRAWIHSNMANLHISPDFDYTMGGVKGWVWFVDPVRGVDAVILSERLTEDVLFLDNGVKFRIAYWVRHPRAEAWTPDSKRVVEEYKGYIVFDTLITMHDDDKIGVSGKVILPLSLLRMEEASPDGERKHVVAWATMVWSTDNTLPAPEQVYPAHLFSSEGKHSLLEHLISYIYLDKPSAYMESSNAQVTAEKARFGEKTLRRVSPQYFKVIAYTVLVRFCQELTDLETLPIDFNYLNLPHPNNVAITVNEFWRDYDTVRFSFRISASGIPHSVRQRKEGALLYRGAISQLDLEVVFSVPIGSKEKSLGFQASCSLKVFSERSTRQMEWAELLRAVGGERIPLSFPSQGKKRVSPDQVKYFIEIGGKTEGSITPRDLPKEALDAFISFMDVPQPEPSIDDYIAAQWVFESAVKKLIPTLSASVVEVEKSGRGRT